VGLFNLVPVGWGSRARRPFCSWSCECCRKRRCNTGDNRSELLKKLIIFLSMTFLTWASRVEFNSIFKANFQVKNIIRAVLKPLEAITTINKNLNTLLKFEYQWCNKNFRFFFVGNSLLFTDIEDYSLQHILPMN